MRDEAAPHVRREVALPEGEPAGLGVLATALEPALREVAGEDAACVSLALEFARAPEPGARLQVSAWVERATRTLVFAAAEGSVDGERAVAASAVFSRG